jgi:mannose-6-phosphate isomerase-like protein (cupin superfamily)
MKIIYKPDEKNEKNGILNSHGFSQCFFKKIAEKKDEKFVTKKEHSHTGFEIHILTSGTQTYQIGEKMIRISCGEFLLVPPRVKHKIVESKNGCGKKLPHQNLLVCFLLKHQDVTYHTYYTKNLCSGFHRVLLSRNSRIILLQIFKNCK